MASEPPIYEYGVVEYTASVKEVLIENTSAYD